MGDGGRSEIEGIETCDGAWSEALRGASTGDKARAASRLLGVCGVIGRTVVIFVRLGKGIVKRQMRHLSQVYMPVLVRSCIDYQGQARKEHQELTSQFDRSKDTPVFGNDVAVVMYRNSSISSRPSVWRPGELRARLTSTCIYPRFMVLPAPFLLASVYTAQFSSLSLFCSAFSAPRTVPSSSAASSRSSLSVGASYDAWLDVSDNRR